MIKSYMALLFLAAFTFSTSTAQVSDVLPGSLTYDDEVVPTIAVHVEPQPDWLKEAFEDYMKDTYKVNLKGSGLFSNKDVLSAEEEVIAAITTDPINFYVQIVRDGSASSIDLFCSKAANYMGEGSSEMEAMKGILVDFLNTRLLTYYEERLEEITDTQEDLQKDIADLQKDIKKNKEDIAKMEREIIEKRSENETMELEIVEFSAQLDEVKGNFAEWQQKQKQMRAALRKFQ